MHGLNDTRFLFSVGNPPVANVFTFLSCKELGFDSFHFYDDFKFVHITRSTSKNISIITLYKTLAIDVSNKEEYYKCTLVSLLEKANYF